MEPHLTLLSLGVTDVGRARRFYVDGLGWPTVLDVPGELLMIQVGHGLVLSLWDLDQMRAEIGPVGAPGLASVALAHNVADAESVTRVLETAVAAGATLVAPAQVREWGGVSGYFADPDGYRWEVAFNPGLTVAADGTVTVG